MSKRFGIAICLVVAAALACDEDPLQPGATTGSIVVQLVTPAPATPAPAASKGAEAAPDAGGGFPAAEVEGEEAREENSFSARVAASAARQVASGSSRNASAAMVLDSVRVSVAGPTVRTVVARTPSGGFFDVTVDQLTPGTYAVAVEGFSANLVDFFGQSTGVSVAAGTPTTTPVTFVSFRPIIANFAPNPTTSLVLPLTFSAVPLATNYRVAWDTDVAFSNPSTFDVGTQTSGDIEVSGLGTYYFRVQAENPITGFGRPSDVESVDVVTDITSSGDDAGSAPLLGFGAGVNQILTDLNVFPSTDVDWFEIRACGGDSVFVETMAERLTPSSNLNTFLHLFESDGSTAVTTNDDLDGTTPDSRIAAEIPTDDTYYITVENAGSGSVGHYELDIQIWEGPGNNGTSCGPLATAVAITPDGASNSVGNSTTFTAQAFDSGSNPIPGKFINWTSLRPNVATVNSSGDVTAVAAGQTIVMAEADGAKDYAVFTVEEVSPTPVNLWAPDVASQSPRLRRAWGSAPDDVWAVGTGATIMHYDGTAWSPVSAPVSSVFLRNVWGSSANDVYAVGDNGTVIHYDGNSWTDVTPSPAFTTEILNGIWGSSPSDVYAVGFNGTIAHFDGTAWSVVTPAPTSENLWDVWGTSKSNVWVVGNSGTILHFDGTSWSADPASGTLTTEALRSIWGFAADDIEVVGNSGTHLHRNSTVWTDVSAAGYLGSNLFELWGATAGDFYSASGAGVYQSTGGPITLMPPNVFLLGVWSIGENDVIAVGDAIHRGYRDASVTVSPAMPAFSAIGDTVTLSAAAEDAAANPISGAVFTWSSDDDLVATVDPVTGLVTTTGLGTATITATAADQFGNPWAGGASGSTDVTVTVPAASVVITPGGASVDVGANVTLTAEVFDSMGNTIPGHPVTWSTLNADVATIGSSSGQVMGQGAGQVVVEVDANGVKGYGVVSVFQPGLQPPNLWVREPIPAVGGNNQLFGVWGTSASNVFAVGDASGILNYDGSTWSLTTITSGQLQTVWGLSTNEVFTGGSAAGVWRYDGTQWSLQSTGTSGGFGGIWGSAPADVYAVGGSTNMFRFDGADFNVVGACPSTSPCIPSGVAMNFNEIWGSSASDIFAVGEGGTDQILHWDGNAWQPHVSNTTEILFGVWGTSPSNVYAVGTNATILHYDGMDWNPEASPGGATEALRDVWGTSDSDVYVASTGGEILHYDGNQWSVFQTGASTLTGVWGFDDQVWVVGTDSTVLRGYRGATVTVTPTTPTLTAINDTLTLTATVRDGSGAIIPNATVTWSSDDDMIASVDPVTGEVQAVGNGTTTIHATALGGATGNTDVTVAQAASRVDVTPDGASVSVGGPSTNFTAQAFDANGVAISNPAITWSTLNDLIVTIDMNGDASGTGSGQAPIGAIVDGVIGYALVTSSNPGQTPVNAWVDDSSGFANGFFADVWGTSDANIWAVGSFNNQGILAHFDGVQWDSVAAPVTSQLMAVWGTTDFDVLTVTSGGAVYQYDGNSWNNLPGALSQTMHDVWAASPVARWIVGSNGTIEFHDGTSWSTQVGGFGEDFNGVWGTSASEVFAVGTAGTILQTTDGGNSWIGMNTQGVTEDLVQIWGTGPTDVWAVGASGTILRYDGNPGGNWAAEPTLTGSNLQAVGGSAPDDVWIVGSSTSTLRWNGTDWDTLSLGGTAGFNSGVWSIPQSPMIVSGNAATIRRGLRGASVDVTPAAHTLVSVGETVQLSAAVLDANATPVAGGTFTWTTSDNLIASVDPFTGEVTANKRGSVVITANAAGGATGTADITVDLPATSVTVSPPGHTVDDPMNPTKTFTVTAMDVNGDVISNPATTWNSLNTNLATIDGSGNATGVESGQVPISATVDGVTGYAMFNVGLITATPVVAWNTEMSGISDNLRLVWGAAQDDVYAVASANNIYHFDGNGWTSVFTTAGGTLFDITGTSSNDVFIVGAAGNVRHWDGANWTTQPTGVAPQSLQGVWAAAPNDVWATGSNGVIIHYDGTSWTEDPASQSLVTGVILWDVHGTASDDVWAVGDNGILLHYDGNSWTEDAASQTLTTKSLFAVWGIDPDTYYVVGQTFPTLFAEILNLTGSIWTSQEATAMIPDNLFKIWGASSREIYAVGSAGRIAFYNGGWNSQVVGTDDFRGLWGGGPTIDFIAVGDANAMERGTR